MNSSQLLPEREALSPNARRALETIQPIIDELSKEIRTISHLLHPPLLDEIGLHAALQQYVSGFSERSRIHTTLAVSSTSDRLPEDMETAIFRIVQECLTNIHRHSGSAKASVEIATREGQIVVEVRDAGQGLQRKDGAARNEGVGIRGMRERVKQFGGSFEIDSSAEGTTVKAILPIPTQRKAGQVLPFQRAKSA
jgi:signal transduction histidine kinase